MTDTTLLDQVLQLPEAERRALIAAVAESLDQEELSPAVRAILDERVADLDSDPDAGRPWVDVRRDLLVPHLP